MDSRVAHDALRRVGPPRLELGLDEDERLPVGRGEPESGGKRCVDGNEGHVADHELRRKGERRHVTDVRALEDSDPAVPADARMKLPVADVERDHAGGAVSEEAVGEAAGRRTHVEAVSTGRVDTERSERVCELLAPTGHEARWFLNGQLGGHIDLCAGLLVAGHEPGQHERLGLAPSFHETPLHEEDIESLLHPWHSRRKMDTVVETVAIGEWTLLVERPRCAETMLDDDAFDEDEFLPYWAETWPAGLALARHVAMRDLAGLTVLELGCGLALPSLTAALAGASVVAGDWAAEAVSLVESNARRNGADVRVELIDWRNPTVLDGARFDLVLAADVLYEERNVAPLTRLFADAMAESGEVLIADPGRRHAAALLTQMRRDGWQLETIPDVDLRLGGIHRLWRDRHAGGRHS